MNPEETMDTTKTEAQLLRAMASATTQAEQQTLAEELEGLRATQAARAKAETESMWADDILAHLRPDPVATAMHSTSSRDSDWLADVPEVVVDTSKADVQMRAEASHWYSRVLSPLAKESAAEIHVQAHGLALALSSQYGDARPAAYQAFMDQVRHHAATEGQDLSDLPDPYVPGTNGEDTQTSASDTPSLSHGDEPEDDHAPTGPATPSGDLDASTWPSEAEWNNGDLPAAGNKAARRRVQAAQFASYEELEAYVNDLIAKHPDLAQAAMKAYDRRDEAWFETRSDEDLKILWEISRSTFFAPYDDEVYEALALRGFNFEASASRKAASLEAHEVQVCTDCLMTAANGYDPHSWGYIPETEPWALWKDTPGHPVAGDGEGHFSHSACEGCGSRPGGDRFQAYWMEDTRTASRKTALQKGDKVSVDGKTHTVREVMGGGLVSVEDEHGGFHTVQADEVTKSASSRRKTASLNDEVEFDSPFGIDSSGKKVDAMGYYAPEVYVVGDGELEIGGNWEALSGHSGQYGYSGPIMHPSETLSGGLERAVREESGVYVITEVIDLDDPEALVGWVVLRSKGGDRIASRETASRKTAAKVCERCGSDQYDDLTPIRDTADQQLEVCPNCVQDVLENGEWTGEKVLRRRASRSKTAISLTGVGVDGPGVGIGTDPSGKRVKFRLSEQDEKDLKAILFSDLAVNFSGVDIEESDIITSGTTASRRRHAVADDDHYGERGICIKCGADVEFVGVEPSGFERQYGSFGPHNGWWDRGGNYECREGGFHESTGAGEDDPFFDAMKGQGDAWERTASRKVASKEASRKTANDAYESIVQNQDLNAPGFGRAPARRQAAVGDTCWSCEGKGYYRTPMGDGWDDPYGEQMMEVTCSTCGGSGVVNEPTDYPLADDPIFTDRWASRKTAAARPLHQIRKSAAEDKGWLTDEPNALERSMLRAHDEGKHSGHPSMFMTCWKCAEEKGYVASRRTASRRKTASGGWLDTARRVVERHQHETVDGMLLDATTASVLVQVHDALGADNKARFAAMPLPQAAEMAWRLAG